MNEKLHQLFDFQQFQVNHRLRAVIGEVEKRYANALNDADLEMVNAAGVISAVPVLQEEPKNEN